MDRINTGGLKSFESTNPERDLKLESEIDKAYEKARIRKRRNRIILIAIIIIFILVLGVGYLI